MPERRRRLTARNCPDQLIRTVLAGAPLDRSATSPGGVCTWILLRAADTLAVYRTDDLTTGSTRLPGLAAGCVAPGSRVPATSTRTSAGSPSHLPVPTILILVDFSGRYVLQQVPPCVLVSPRLWGGLPGRSLLGCRFGGRSHVCVAVVLPRLLAQHSDRVVWERSFSWSVGPTDYSLSTSLPLRDASQVSPPSSELGLV